MRKRILALVLSLSLALSLCACEEGSSSSKIDSGSSAETTTTTTTTPTTTTTTTEPEPVVPEIEKFDINGIEVDSTALSDNGALTLEAIDCSGDLSYGGQDITFLNVLGVYDGKVVVNTTTDTTSHCYFVDLATGELLFETSFELYKGTEIRCFDNGFFILKTADNKHEYTVYDYDFNVIRSFELNCCSQAEWPDGIDYAYYLLDYQIYKYNVKEGTSELITGGNDFYIDTIYDATIIDGDVVFDLQTAENDLSLHEGFFNVDTGEIYYFEDETGHPSIEDGVFKYTAYDDDFFLDHFVFSNGKDNVKRFDVDYHDDNSVVVSNIIDDHRIVFSERSGDITKLQLYDFKKGEVTSTTTVDCSKFVQSEQEVIEKFDLPDDYDFSTMMDLDTTYYVDPLVIDENRLLLYFVNSFYSYYIVWDTSKGCEFTPNISVSEASDIEEYYTASEILFVEEILKPSTEALSEKELAARAKADEIEKKYNIEIIFGGKDITYMGYYILHDLEGYYTYEDDYIYRLSTTLDILDTELAKYPDGFLDQIENDNCTKYRFILCGTIQGINYGPGVLTAAGGFKCSQDGYINIAVSAGNILSTIHHELSHSIDQYVEDKLGDSFSDGWNALNPQDDLWYSGEATIDELYYESSLSGADVSGAYYIDNYGHTNATEDRARIFETIMNSEHMYNVDYNKAPHLKAKLNFYAQSIRNAFEGSESWGTMPWEKYMEIAR